MYMKNLFFHRTWVEVNLKKLRDNFETIRKTVNQKIYAVVKADAYGHGAVQVATVLEKAGVDGFAVSNLVEAEELRQAGIQSSVLILGYTPAEYALRLAQGDFAQCLYSVEYAQKLDRWAQKEGVTVKAHLKLDTGMGRLGFDLRTDDLTELEEAKRMLKLEHVNTIGVFMHFAVADSADGSDVEFTQAQYDRFWNAVAELEKEHPFQERHCCNSAATLCLEQEKGDAVRAGIILYGLEPSADVVLPPSIQPVMSLYSVVSMVKTVDQDQTVSYGRTYAATGKRKIATVSAGYADGVPRLLSNKGSVLIRNQRAPIVGRVCMDQLCVDVTDIADVAMGDVVTIFGAGLPVEEVAAQAQTINYEIICGITKRVPRIYIE